MSKKDVCAPIGEAQSRRRVTIRDVAKRAGVSQTTVSFVLNHVDAGRIGAQAKERVRAAARDLGYRHTPNRRTAQTPRLRTIGMLIDEIATSPMNALSIEGAQRAAMANGWLIVIGKTGGDPAVEEAYRRRWHAHNIDGLIYASVFTRAVTVPPAWRTGPLVLLNCHAEDGDISAILPGEVMGGHAATEALIRNGHRRIGFIGGESWMEAARDRLAGYCQALTNHDLPFDERLVAHADFLPSGGRNAARALLASKAPPSALFCASDLMALGAYDAIKERGLRVPDDVAVIGYDDLEIAAHLDPPLSTIRLPHDEMGEIAATTLMDWHGERSSPLRRKVECTLIRRASL